MECLGMVIAVISLLGALLLLFVWMLTDPEKKSDAAASTAETEVEQ